MSASASVRHLDGIAILDLRGRLTLGEGAGLVRDTVRDLVEAGERDILVNLRDVSYIDSAGLGALVAAYANVSNGGGHVKLLNAQKGVAGLLQTTKLVTVFEIFSHEADAVESFRGPGR
jgi:anti-sigma B factor antagonist